MERQPEAMFFVEKLIAESDASINWPQLSDVVLNLFIIFSDNLFTVFDVLL